MKNFTYLFTTFAVILSFTIISCTMMDAPESENGSLALILEFSDGGQGNPSDGKPDNSAEIQTLDQVHCTITKAGATVVNQNLTLSGSVFRGNFSVPAGSGYNAQIDCYKSTILAYTGTTTGITVTAGETTIRTVTLSATLPQAPTSLTAIASGSDVVNLAWVDVAVNETGYKIERKTGSAGTYSEIAVVTAGTTTYQNTGLTPNTQYYFRVRAYNTAGNSGFSNESNAVTSDVAPTAPSGLTLSVASATQINLSWADNSGNETGFKIERKTGSAGAYSEIATVSANVVTYQNTGLTSNTEYYYRVRAYNTIGNSSYSNEAHTTTTMTVPTAPTSLAASPISSSQINLSWNDNSNNEDGFKIERKTGLVGIYSEIAAVGGNTTTYQNTGLSANTTYYYRVRAYNLAGNSSYSNESNATTNQASPSAPTGLTASTASSSQINLSWTDNANNEDGFRIERRTGLVGTYSEVGTVSANVTSYQSTGLTAGTQYYYRVRAYNGIGNSLYSNEANATTNQAAPTAPANLQTTSVSGTQINLSWNDNSSNEDGFKIERKTGSSGTYAEIATVNSNVSTYQSVGLEPLTIYYFRVRAYNSGGNSSYSNESNVSTGNPNAGYVRSFPLGTTGLNIEMVWIPAGNFMQGSFSGETGQEADELPQHQVTFSYGFWLGKYEVTQAQWDAIMGNWAHNFDNNPNRPAEMLSYEDITIFTTGLNTQTAGSDPWRLPSESEWEYAYRAGTTTRFYWGDDPNYTSAPTYCWLGANSGGETHDVGTRQPNNWGLYDMAGNVWEVVVDYYHSDYNGAPTNGSAWMSPAFTHNVRRGASFPTDPVYLRAANRAAITPDAFYYNQGLRLARNAQ